MSYLSIPLNKLQFWYPNKLGNGKAKQQQKKKDIQHLFLVDGSCCWESKHCIRASHTRMKEVIYLPTPGRDLPFLVYRKYKQWGQRQFPNRLLSQAWRAAQVPLYNSRAFPGALAQSISAWCSDLQLHKRLFVFSTFYWGLRKMRGSTKERRKTNHLFNIIITVIYYPY